MIIPTTNQKIINHINWEKLGKKVRLKIELIIFTMT